MYGVRWLTCVCKVACRTGHALKQWQSSAIILIHMKGDKRKCTNYRSISLISVPSKTHAKCLEKKCLEIVELKLTDAQCGFRPGRSTIDQIFALQQIFEKTLEYAKVNACFVDLEKAYDRIPRDKLWAVLLQYGIDGQLLTAIKSLYMHSEVCVRVNSATTKPFRVVSVGLRQGCSLSSILFLIYMDRIVKKSESCDGIKIGNCTVQRLLFADGLVLLDSTQNGLQQALDRFSDACSVAGMKISLTKTETMCLFRQPKQCSLQIDEVPPKQSEKFKYHGVSFTSDGRQNSELDIRFGKASAVTRQLHQSVVLKRELCTKAKLSIFRSDGQLSRSDGRVV